VALKFYQYFKKEKIVCLDRDSFVLPGRVIGEWVREWTRKQTA